MMRLCAFCAIILSLLMAGGANAARIRKDVSEYAGKACNGAPRGSDVVVGYFSGYEESPMASDDGYVGLDRLRCFKTIDECRGWLYTMQSLYGVPPPSVTSCQQR